MMSILLLLSTAYSLSTITVLEDWRISINNDVNNIHAGDTVVIQSTYNKLHNTSGTATRYITCLNRSDLWVRYELNRATSNRGKGKGGTGIILVIRRDIADLPTKCKFEIAIEYEVMPFKKVNVHNQTQEFELKPERPLTILPTATDSSQVAEQSSDRMVEDSSSSNINPPINIAQPENSQEVTVSNAEPEVITAQEESQDRSISLQSASAQPTENSSAEPEQPSIMEVVANFIRRVF